MAALGALSWVYNYVTGKQPTGSNAFDNAGGLIGDVKERAKDFSPFAPGRAQDSVMGGHHTAAYGSS